MTDVMPGRIPPASTEDPVESDRQGIAAFNRAVGALDPAMVDVAIASAREAFGPIPAPICEVSATADLLALDLQRAVQRRVRRLYTWLGAALVVFGVTNLFEYAVVAYVVALGVLALVVYRFRRAREEDRFLDYRALAEGLRVLGWWRAAGIEASAAERYPGRHQEAIGWVRAAVAAIERAAGSSGAALPDVGRVRSRWVRDQAEYFRRKSDQVRGAARRWDRVLGVAVALSIAVAIGYAATLMLFDAAGTLAGPRFQSMLGVIAGVGVTAQAYQTKQGYAELANQFRLMHRLFEQADQDLEARPGRAREILLRLGDEALQENTEWLAYHRRHPVELVT
ncbi:MAG: DUF4231 domain-containing protein [Gemmatimonadales bacterium]